MKHYFKFAGLLVGCLSAALLSARPFDLGVTGLWAPKAGDFSGGGVSIRGGYRLNERHGLELEVLGLFEQARTTSVGTISEINPKYNKEIYQDTYTTAVKFNRRQLGAMANYRYHQTFDVQSWTIGFYLGGGIGTLYSTVKSTGMGSTVTVQSFYGDLPLTSAVTEQVPGVSGRTTAFWSPAAQLFAGATLGITEQLSLTAGARVLFTKARTIALYGRAPWIQAKIKAVQPMLEAGLSYSF